MKKYRLLMQGKNFLIDIDGVPRKHSFSQNVIIEAESPQRATLLAKAKLSFDRELKSMTLNAKNDPPIIERRTFWELDIAEDDGDFESDRIFYPEKKWWQFWKRTTVPVEIPPVENDPA